MLEEAKTERNHHSPLNSASSQNCFLTALATVTKWEPYNNRLSLGALVPRMAVTGKPDPTPCALSTGPHCPPHPTLCHSTPTPPTNNAQSVGGQVQRDSNATLHPLGRFTQAHLRACAHRSHLQTREASIFRRTSSQSFTRRRAKAFFAYAFLCEPKQKDPKLLKPYICPFPRKDTKPVNSNTMSFVLIVKYCSQYFKIRYNFNTTITFTLKEAKTGQVHDYGMLSHVESWEGKK